MSSDPAPPHRRFQFRLRTMMIGVTLFCVAGGGSLSAVAWLNRTGIFSLANYQRIPPGMTLPEVERLLGGRGTEKFEGELPETVDPRVPIGSPNRMRAVVVGDHYLRWDNGNGAEIIVSLRRGVVSEKWYWAPSL
jgi:hypothetical protein